jgi:hypothetical protein
MVFNFYLLFLIELAVLFTVLRLAQSSEPT